MNQRTQFLSLFLAALAVLGSACEPTPAPSKDVSALPLMTTAKPTAPTDVQSSVGQSPTAQPIPTPAPVRWQTGYIDEATPLEGPIVITFLRSGVDPASPKKQYIYWTGRNDWFSPEDFSGQLYIKKGEFLKTRKDFSPREVVYSGYIPATP